MYTQFSEWILVCAEIVLRIMLPCDCVEYSLAFCKLTFGRTRDVDGVQLVDGDESNSNCCT